MARPDAEDIGQKLQVEQKIDESYMPFGNGHSADTIVSLLEGNLKK